MKQAFAPFRQKVLTDFVSVSESQAAASDALASYIDNMDDHRSHGKGLTLLGPNGVGKTMLANVVINEAQNRGYRVEAIELWVYVDLLKDKFDLQSLMKATDDERIVDQYVTTRQHLRYIEGMSKRSADWVLFDDVGREFPSDSGWSQGKLFDVMRSRFDRNLSTLLTSNLSIAELEDRYTKGLGSFLKEATEVIVVEGDDFRWKRDD
jgi:DNA replication protein DnaC